MTITDYNLHLHCELDTSMSSYGGEYNDGDYVFADYGLQIGDVSIGNITPEQYKKLGLSIINHLAVNGHSFCMVNIPGEGEQLSTKDY